MRAGPADDQGKQRWLLMSDGSGERIDARLTDSQIKARFHLDRVTRTPKIDFGEGLLLDGPLTGTTTYAVNELGFLVELALPAPPTGWGQPVSYEVVTQRTDGEPAEFRHRPALGR